LGASHSSIYKSNHLLLSRSYPHLLFLPFPLWPLPSPLVSVRAFSTLFVHSLNTRLLLESEFPPSGYHESHDIELQSPVTGSFLVSEKNGNFASPPDTPQQSTSRVSHVGLSRPTPIRKYSRNWWEANWNVAVAHRVWPRILYIAFGFLVVIIWVATT
jgi:hypothetical protein